MFHFNKHSKLIKIPNVSINFRADSFAVSAIVYVFSSLLLALFAIEKDVENIRFLVPMMAVSFAFMAYSSYVRCDSMMTLCLSVIMSIGVVVQCILMPDKTDMVTNEFLFSSALSVCLTAIFSFIGKHFIEKENRKSIVYLLLIWLATIAVTVLLRLGPSTNGTYAWLYLGSLQIQATTLFVPAFILYEAILYTSLISKKWLFSTGYLLTLALSLGVCNELGTLIIISILWIINMLMFGELRKSMIIIASFSGVGIVGIIAIALAKFQVNKLCSLGETASQIVTFLSRIYDKIFHRFSDWINVKELPRYEQAATAWRAIVRGGLLGSNNEAFIAEEIYDYTFAAILQRMGFLFGLVIVVLYTAIFIISITKLSGKYIKHQLSFINFFSIGASIAFFVSSIIPIFTNTAFLPLMGVSLPLISSGMTSGVVYRFLILTVILNCKERLLFNPIRIKNSRAFNDEAIER